MKPWTALPAAARARGFTFVELVMVIIVLAVLGGMAVPRFFERTGFDAASYNERLKAMLRYGQKIAIAQGRNVYVRVNGSGVVLAYDPFYLVYAIAPAGTNDGSASTVSLCGNTANRACAGVPGGLTLTGGTSFYFDPTGRPFLLANTPPTLTSTFTTLVLALTGDGSTHNVTVAAETGYVY
ncbi:Tfp pilus assembly protein FimT/FimU [Pseudoduganella danionis]|uniref:Prepilin-type N-terminal cleavage/methylation domain-containing protein n=1 Tax=Pseudoduganella danionis TaxID=1890295 RepID=A0ABW9SNC9_9BURK|nr:prepilin-type N-terminal cleavage/methylation domain-containing protein [Pseudoduganella danionis]MTW32713.1 prepilin-type N-terminal cleavage/methylation domain-containing protein [Pseudoduganella danionis]